MYAEAVVGQYFYTLYLLIVTKGFAEGTDVFFHVAVAGYEYVA